MQARSICDDLRHMGIDPWLDEDELLGGTEWEPAIRDAVRSCSHFIALVSLSSVQKTGFVQKEVRQALDLLEYRAPGEVFVIPVRLDHAEPRHERLRLLQWIDLFGNYAAGMSRLGRSLGAEPDRIASFMVMLERRPLADKYSKVSSGEPTDSGRDGGRSRHAGRISRNDRGGAGACRPERY